MVYFIVLLGFLIELFSLLSFFVVVYYVNKIDSIYKGFNKAWFFISLGFFLAIFRRWIDFFTFFIEGDVKMIISDIIIPLILLLTSIVLIIGFYRLYNVFSMTHVTKNSKKGR